LTILLGKSVLGAVPESATKSLTRQDVEDAYQKYGHLVVKRCRRILRDPGLAEDAAQEVFVRLWRYGSAFFAAESKLFWLYRVADRCCFDELGRRRSSSPDELESLAASPEPLRAIEAKDVVLSFLDRFDDRTKQVAVLYYLDELSQEEIADAIGWSRQTVSKKLAFLRDRATRLRMALCGTEAGT
jgi:RNA polymerase sigma-70 factor (ECF subfamily)